MVNSNELAASNEVPEEEVKSLQDSITAQINSLNQIDELVAEYSGRINVLQQEAEDTAVDEEDLEELIEAFDAELDILLEDEESMENLEEALEEVTESIEDDEDKDDDDDDNEDEDEE